MKLSFLRVAIGLVLFAATPGGINPVEAAPVTQLDITGDSIDLNLGMLGHVGGPLDRSGMLVLGQYQPAPHIIPPVVLGPWTFSIFTSGTEGHPAPTGETSDSDLIVDLRALFAGVTGPLTHSPALNIGNLIGLATGNLNPSTDGFLRSWSHDLSGSGVPFLQSGALSLHGQAQGGPLPIQAPPAAVILFGSGLFGIVGVVVRRDMNVRGQRETVTSQARERKDPFGQALILLVSPDAPFAKEIEEHLARTGYLTHVVSSVSDACLFARQGSPALTLLDQRLSDWDSLRTDMHFRHVPMMTLVPAGIAYGDDDCISDLERGVDGIHLCQEGHKLLLAKVRTYLRRAGYVASKRGVYRVGGVELDSDLHEVKIGSHCLPLSAKPFALLEAMMKAPSKVLSRSVLIDHVWGTGFAISDHTLDVYVHTLRQQLDRAPGHLCQLITIKGVGFKLKPVSPGMPASSVPDALQIAVNSFPPLQPGGDNASKTQPSLTPSPSRRRRTWLRRVSRHRRARPLRRKKSVRYQ